MAKKEDNGGSVTTPTAGGMTAKKKRFTDEIGKYCAIVLLVGLIAVALSALI